MGFSVTAANVIFALAMLTAFSAAVGAYWKTQDHIEDSRRVHERRILEAVHTNVTFVGTPTYDAGNAHVTFTLKNAGGVGLDFTQFEYLVDGTIQDDMAAGYPLLNGAPTTSVLLLPGDVMDVRLEAISTNPTRLQVVTETGIPAHYP